VELTFDSEGIADTRRLWRMLCRYCGVALVIHRCHFSGCSAVSWRGVEQARSPKGWRAPPRQSWMKTVRSSWGRE